MNPWFYYYQQDPSTGYVSQGYHSMNYVVYDANQAENWIYSNQQDLGGFPSNGWTIMWLNLTELPSYDFENYSAFLKTSGTGRPMAQHITTVSVTLTQTSVTTCGTAISCLAGVACTDSGLTTSALAPASRHILKNYQSKSHLETIITTSTAHTGSSGSQNTSPTTLHKQC